MINILVTGASGNVGREVVNSLNLDKNIKVISAVGSKDQLAKTKDAVLFDFMDESTWDDALIGIDKLFLMRPPAISDVKTYLFPVIDRAIEKGIKQIVFLSLQGVQFNPLTPHFKVEKYLKRVRAPYTFIRPNFFMQNLSTFYADDIKQRNEIFLPAGKGKTAFVDTRDIGAVIARTLSDDSHIGKAYTLTGSDSLDYYQVADVLSKELNRAITYRNPTVQQYADRLKTNKADEGFIKVQKMLYFVVRHNFSAGTTDDIYNLLGRKPITFNEFAHDYAKNWQ